MVWNWYHFVAIGILHQPRPTDSVDINTRLQLSDTSSIPPMHGGFLLLSSTLPEADLDTAFVVCISVSLGFPYMVSLFPCFPYMASVFHFLLIWLCTSNSVFLWVVVTKSPQLIKVRDLNGCHGNHTTFWTLPRWSQLKAQQSLLLHSTISTTSWNYIFVEQDGFEVVIWCVGWCVKKNESSKVCFYKCKSILPTIQSIECRSFFRSCCPRVALQNDTNG